MSEITEMVRIGVVTVAPSLGSSYCEIPWSRFSHVAGVKGVNSVRGIFEVACRLPTGFINSYPFNFVLTTPVV